MRIYFGKQGYWKGVDSMIFALFLIFIGRNLEQKKQGTENIWRWRVGDYRIIAEVKNQELIIQVIKITHRQEAYK